MLLWRECVEVARGVEASACDTAAPHSVRVELERLDPVLDGLERVLPACARPIVHADGAVARVCGSHGGGWLPSLGTF